MTGVVCELMWSDPKNDTFSLRDNPRGFGHVFGIDVLDKFLHEQNFEKVIRSHQLVMEGYWNMFDDKITTIWSAPNYCYRCGNMGGVVRIREDLSMDFNVYKSEGSRVNNLSILFNNDFN